MDILLALATVFWAGLILGVIAGSFGMYIFMWRN